jgi:pilus assembly protein CpaB
MRAKSMALLMLALGCGLVASIGITQVMAKRNAEPASTGETQPILIASKDIPLGERLTVESLKLEAWPKDKIPAGSVAKLEDAQGLRTRTKLYAGEPILEKKLLGKGASMQGESSLIPKGMRVVSVKVDNVSGGPGLTLPGDRVDVMVHLVRNSGSDIQETSTRTILKDIKVFAVNDIVDMERDKDSSKEKDRERLSAKTISLLVTPPQAAKLTLASELGKIRLIMRGPEPEEDKDVQEGTAKPGELFGTATKANRDKESLLATPSQPDKNAGLLKMMEDLKKQAANLKKAVPAAISSEIWPMRILQPNGIIEVTLEADNSPEAAKMPQGGWHLLSSNTVTVSGGGSGSGSSNNKHPAAMTSAPTAPSAPQAGGPAVEPPAEPANEPAKDPNSNPAPQNTNPAPQDANPAPQNTSPTPQDAKPAGNPPAAEPVSDPGSELNQGGRE